MQSYLQVGELTLKGVNIYPKIANLRHPYLPLYLYFEAIAVWLGSAKMEIIILLKFVNILFDLGILYLIYLLSKKDLKTAFFYSINPVTIFITTLHGQFDVIPIFFLLLSIYFLNKKNDAMSIIFYSVSILIKTWPILFIVPISRKIKNKKIIPLIIFFPLLSIITYIWLFKSSLIDIIKTIFFYQGLWGIWGIWIWFGKTRIFWQKMTTFLFLTSFFGYSMINKTKDIIKNILQLLVFFFVFTTNFSIQYFTWIAPFLILIKPKKCLNLMLLISMYLFSFYSIWLFNVKSKNTTLLLTFAQNLIGFFLWISFIKIWYLSKK